MDLLRATWQVQWTGRMWLRVLSTGAGES
jgi:hypothetical protein